MEFLCNEWLVDVATDHIGKAIIIAHALTMIERSLLDQRPCFFITAGRRGSGKTTLIIMLIMAVTGCRPAAAAWSSDENERRKSLLAYFMAGVPYIVWDNIPRGTQDLVPAYREVLHHRALCRSHARCERSSHHFRLDHQPSSPAITSERRATWPRAASTSASSSTASTPKTGISSTRTRSDGRKTIAAKILRALYTILLGNPQLKAARDAPGKTRFKMWWRLVGSAVEHAAERIGQKLDFKDLFIVQEEDDEELASLGDVLDILAKKWPKGFSPLSLAKMVNDPQEYESEDAQTGARFFAGGEGAFYFGKIRRQAAETTP